MKRSTKVGAVAFASAVVMGIGTGDALAGVNQPPVCNSATHDIAHNAVLNSTVAPLCSDPDQGATLTYGLGETAVANGVLTSTPSPAPSPTRRTPTSSAPTTSPSSPTTAS